jgi:hypothetical protein
MQLKNGNKAFAMRICDPAQRQDLNPNSSISLIWLALWCTATRENAHCSNKCTAPNLYILPALRVWPVELNKSVAFASIG